MHTYFAFKKGAPRLGSGSKRAVLSGTRCPVIPCCKNTWTQARDGSFDRTLPRHAIGRLGASTSKRAFAGQNSALLIGRRLHAQNRVTQICGQPARSSGWVKSAERVARSGGVFNNL